MERVVIDTCAFSNFGLTGTFWIVEALYDSLLTTQMVIEEIEKGFSAHPPLKIVIKKVQSTSIKIISDLTEEEFELFGKLSRALSDTDKSCLVVARFRKCTLLTDDWKLIKEASKHKVQTIGTVEVLEIAAKKNIVSYNKAKIILDEMEIKANFKLTTTIKKPK